MSLPGKLFAPKECDIQKACEDLLQWDGWRIFRLEQNWSDKKRKAVGEPGAPDCLAIRYRPPSDWGAGMPGLATVLMVEWKKVGGKNAPHQKAWQAAERARGALVIVGGEDFTATSDGFLEWYRISGLNRRPI